MILTIELPDDLDALLKNEAQAKGVSAAGNARNILEQALTQQKGQTLKPKKSAYGLFSQYGPGPSAEEIDENRRDMFRDFGEIAQ